MQQLSIAARLALGSSKSLFVRDATGLTRSLSGWDAMVGNVLAMGVSYFMVFAFFASLLYPGVNLPYTVLVTLVPCLIVATIYYLFTVAMPRTGGDYVWVSRVINPPIGFMTNFLMTFNWLSSLAVAVAWGVSYGIGPMLAALGLLNSNPGLISLSTTISSPPTAFILTLILISLTILPLLLGTRAAFRMMWVLFIVAAIGTMVMVGAFFSAPQSTFMANFNKLSGMDYSKTITSAGLPLGFTVGATLTGSIFTITNFSGYFTSSYFSGEMKRVNKSQLMAMYGSLIVLTIVSMLTYASVYYSAGSDFLNAVSYLAGTGSSSYTLPATPVLNYLVVFATPNPTVVILSGLGLFATGLGGAVLFAFICVRNLFAWSFDGVMPTALVRLDSRRNSPYITILVIWVFSMFFAWVYFYTQFFAFYVYSTLLIFIALLLTSIAAVVFPYRAKHIFDLSPSMVKKKFGSVPLISILGVLGIIVNAYLAYATLQPAVTPPPTGPPLVQLLAYAIVPVVGIAALVIYGISYAHRKSHGLNLSAVFSEIPPE